MKSVITSVLMFPYANKLEVRVSRGAGFNTRPSGIRVYSAPYTDKDKVYRLARLASELNFLVVMKMVEYGVTHGNPFA